MEVDTRCYNTQTCEEEWIVDSGATRHMTYLKNGLVNYKPISAAVEVGGKYELHVMGIGDKCVRMKTNCGDHELLLRGVLRTINTI